LYSVTLVERSVAGFDNLFTSLLSRAWPPKTRVQNVRKDDEKILCVLWTLKGNRRLVVTLNCSYYFETPNHTNLSAFALAVEDKTLRPAEMSEALQI